MPWEGRAAVYPEVAGRRADPGNALPTDGGNAPPTHRPKIEPRCVALRRNV